MINFIIWIVAGGLAGWIASIIMGTNKQMGALANIVAGIIGAFIGGWVIGLFGMSAPEGELNLPSILTAVLGAMIVIWVVKLLTGKK